MIYEEKSSSYICKLLKKIVRAQVAAHKKQSSTCELTCSLLENGHSLNTIPIMLICRKKCDVFIGTGVYEDKFAYHCIKTPIFRVNKIIEDHCGDCYVVLELLQRKKANHEDRICPAQDVCSFFPNQKSKQYIRTGICLTLNIDCFCGIQCLPAIKVEQGKPTPTPPQQKHELVEEKICGNFSSGQQTVWESLSFPYKEGTFQIYNSAHSLSPAHVWVVGHTPIAFPEINQGITISRSITYPTSLVIEAPEGTSGKYCITLFKTIPLESN